MIKSRHFSLVELIVTITLLAILAGVVVPIIADNPAFVSLHGTTQKVRELLLTARTRAIVHGKKVGVAYNHAEKTFSMVHEPDEDIELIEQDMRYMTLRLPECINVELPEDLDEDEPITFNFLPDNSAGGPRLVLELKSHRLALSVSSLTGRVRVIEVEDE